MSEENKSESQLLLERIKLNKSNTEKGIYNSIPFPFPRLSKYFAGFEKGHIIDITSGTGQGKTTLGKYLTVIHMYRFFKQNKYKGKIFYFALEESKTDFWASISSYILAAKFNVKLKPGQILSKGDWQLSDIHLKMLEEIIPIIEDMQKYIEVIDHIYNGYGVKRHIDTFFDNPEVGTHIYKEIDDIRNGVPVKVKIKVGYKYKNEDDWYMVVIDHINLTTAEKDISGYKMTKHESLGYLSKEYFLKVFSKRYNMVTVFMQQQTASGEALDFYKDLPIAKKLEPSIANLGGNKEIAQECHIILGVFNPSKYDLHEHDGYNLHWLGRNYCSLIILKDRPNGLTGLNVPLYYREDKGIFVEVPKSLKLKDYKTHENYKKFLEGTYVCPLETQIKLI